MIPGSSPIIFVSYYLVFRCKISCISDKYSLNELKPIYRCFADTDELSSGEYGEIIGAGTKPDDVGEAEGAKVQKDPTVHSTSIHAEIQRNYEELQQKLSLEFHKKLHGWERMKASSSGCRCPGGDDGFLHHDKGFRRKMEEWERMKHPQQNQGGNPKHRDSVAFQMLDEDALSPDFRKKLQVRTVISIWLYSSTCLKRIAHDISCKI
jgi:hypothetical protein